MNGPAARLFDALGDNAMLYTIAPADVGLSDAHAEPSALYCHERMSALRAAVATAFDGPVLFAAEVGEGSGSQRGRLHLHIVAHRADGPPHVRRDSERCKAVYDPQGVLEYLGKPPERWSLEAEGDFRTARLTSSRARAPQTRGKLLGRERMAWAEANALSASFAEPPQPPPLKSSSERATMKRSPRTASPVESALASPWCSWAASPSPSALAPFAAFVGGARRSVGANVGRLGGAPP